VVLRGFYPDYTNTAEKGAGIRGKDIGFERARHAHPGNGCIVRHSDRPKVRYFDSNSMKNKEFNAEGRQKYGGPTWTRTRDKRIMSKRKPAEFDAVS